MQLLQKRGNSRKIIQDDDDDEPANFASYRPMPSTPDVPRNARGELLFTSEIAASFSSSADDIDPPAFDYVHVPTPVFLQASPGNAFQSCSPNVVKNMKQQQLNIFEIFSKDKHGNRRVTFIGTNDGWSVESFMLGIIYT